MSPSQTLAEAIEQFGLTSTAIRAVRSGRVNKHWFVDTSRERYVLRRYRPERSPAAIDYELAALQQAARHGWPVALPVAAADGQRIIELSGSRYALFPRLPGRRTPYDHPGRTQTTGEMLARFHRDMEPLAARGQRDGFGRLSELDVYVQTMSSFPTYAELLRAFERTSPVLARAVWSERHENSRELTGRGYDDLASTLIHADFHHDNLLFQRGHLTGLLDFDFVRLDGRIADVAMSVVLDCADPPTYNRLRPEYVEAFVAGYTAVSPLAEAEVNLLVPLARAYFLWLIAYRLCERRAGFPERAVRSVRRSLEIRLVNMERDRPALAAAVRRGAGATSAPPGLRTR